MNLIKDAKNSNGISSRNGLQFAAWNQDSGCFCCGMANGFRIYNTDPLRERERCDFDGDDGAGIGYIEMLFRCNYLALVGGGRNPKYSPNKVIIWDDLKKRSILEIDCSPEQVCAVRLRRDRIIVVLSKKIIVYTLTQPPQKLNDFETGNNPSGICALCPDSRLALLAYPAKRAGHVEVINLAEHDRGPKTLIAAHESVLSLLAINLDGTRLATTSVKGTLIRIWCPKTADKLMELRRGANHATIFSMAFNRTSTQMCVASDHGTVHIFNLETNKSSEKGLFSTSGSLGPINKLLANQTSFCKINLRNHSPCICTFGEQTATGNGTVIVVCGDGSYYKFSYTSKGESFREKAEQYLEMTEPI